MYLWCWCIHLFYWKQIQRWTNRACTAIITYTYMYFLNILKTACIYYQVDRMLLNINFFSIIYRHRKNMHWVQQIIISFPNLHWFCHVWFNILAWSIQLSLIFLSWYGMTSTLIDGTNLLRKHWSTFFCSYLFQLMTQLIWNHMCSFLQ